MAKLLIIDDQIQMVRILQEYMQNINPSFSPVNTFCFNDGPDGLQIRPWTYVKDEYQSPRVSFGQMDDVFPLVCVFLSEHRDENVLILIDVLLNSADINAPSYEKYLADREFSCEMYAELNKLKNGKECAPPVNPEHFFHIIYSRSDASLSVVATALKKLYSPEEDEYFPRECYLPQNISWCKNQCDESDADNIVLLNQTHVDSPLILPGTYKDFIRELT